MEKVFVYGIQDEKMFETLIKWYDQHSTTAKYVREEIVTLYMARRCDGFEVPLAWSREVALPCVKIVCNRPLEVIGSIGNKTA
jgi:hypothetical protein